MRKILIAVALVIAFAMPIAEADAHPICPPAVVAVSAGAVTTSSIIFGSAVGLGALATWAIATNQTNPLCEIGLQCYSEYPTGANHVFVQAQTVSYTSGHVDNFDHPTIKYTEDGKRYLSSN